MTRTTGPASLALLGLLAMTAASDEGMWLVTDPPRELLRERHGFDLTDEWLTRATRAAVRFNNGGSGGFVSPEGLIVTNHHIGADALQKLTRPDRNLIRDGFLARSRSDELKCPDLELNVLQSVEDVTGRVNAAVRPGADAAAARRAVMAEIEKESTDKTGLRSDVVTLYQGGMYHLYRSKKYTDVRLVFAPESAAASFGGDVDNFEFPRFGFDVCFFRAYENDQPASVEHFFQWSKAGPAEGDLVFVVGHPGTTNRMETVARLLHRRDHGHPYALARLRSREASLLQFSERGPEERVVAATDLHSVANARKATAGQYQGLLDPRVIETKRQEEAALKRHDASAADAWEAVAKAHAAFATFERPYFLAEKADAFFTELFTIARHLVRFGDELPKPNATRLREYRDSNLASLKLQVFSPAPIDARLETAKLAASLSFLAEQLGGEHPLAIKALAGRTPAARAADLVSGCTLFDPAKRKALFDGGAAAVAASGDPMIQLACTVDADSRALRKRYENEVEEPERQAYARIAKVRFALLDRRAAPDATFTLRLAFGVVNGYEEAGQSVPFQTTMAGLFQRAEGRGNREPFKLAPRWRDGKSLLDLATPMNFVSTADTIGGNSGSPVLNRAGELVGVNFDRNRPGLVRNFVYTDVGARHIAVHGRAVAESLAKLYDAGGLLGELRGAH